MRLLFLLMTFLLFAGVLGFVVTNLETEVSIQVWETVHEGVPLYLVGIVAVFVGIAYAGLIAVAEGAHIRLANRRMEREIHRLETEVNYLRTQPSGARTEPDEEPDSEFDDRDGYGATEATVRGGGPGAIPSAPVYETDDDPTDDDDVYTGGRAV